MKTITRRAFTGGIALLPSLRFPAARAQTGVTPAEARAIAKEAYIYGFPMVDSYRIQYAYFVDRQGPEFKAPWNHIVNTARVYTPADTAIQTPNSDTPYSFVGMDLRAEPLVLTVPPIEKERYFSIQLIDAYTFNFAYIGSRATGNDGGSYPHRRTGLEGRETQRREQGHSLRDGIGLRHLSHAVVRSGRHRQRRRRYKPAIRRSRCRSSLGSPHPPRAPVDFIKPLTPAEEKTSLAVIQHPELRFAVLPHCPIRESPHGALRQNRRRRGQDLRRQQAFA